MLSNYNGMAGVAVAPKLILISILVFLLLAGSVFALCTDTDGGKNYNVKGTVNYNGKLYTDSCLGSYVKENFCSSGRNRYTYYKCQNGCFNGACIVPQVCGNSIIEGAEQCDAGINNGVPCPPSYGQTCTYCNTTCKNQTLQGSYCGDGTIDLPDEACDDNNTIDGDGCSSACMAQCAENWSCTSFSSCSLYNATKIPHSTKTRSCTDLNSCGTTYLEPQQTVTCACYNTWITENDTIDIGNPADEDGQDFDFGTSTSPVEEGWIHVSENTLYNSSAGYGWISQPAGSRDRIIGTNLTRDLIFDSVLREFVIDINDLDEYTVTIYFGDMSFAHDEMQAVVEGHEISNISTLAGEVVNITVYIGKVLDGQLNINFSDEGGSNIHWTITGVELKKNYNLQDWGPIEPLTHGGNWGSPSGACCNYGLQPAFDGTAMVVSDPLSSDNATLNITFGGFENLYRNRMIEIWSLEGISLNDSFDVYLNNNKIYSFFDNGTRYWTEQLFDFGTPLSPVESGYTQVTPDTLYNETISTKNITVWEYQNISIYYNITFFNGTDYYNQTFSDNFSIVVYTNQSVNITRPYGWLTRPIDSRDRVNGTNLTRDLIFDSVPREFIVDAPDASDYIVTVYFGDMSFAHDDVSVEIEGQVVFSNVDTAAGEIKALTAWIGNVNDGQINIVFKDEGGSNIHWTIAGVDVKRTFCSEIWIKHTVNIPDNIDSGLLKFVSTAPHWQFYNPYGQVAVSQIRTKWQHNVNVCE